MSGTGRAGKDRLLPSPAEVQPLSIPTIDCIIATIADDNGCYILARDRDMETILATGLVKLGRRALPSSPS